VAQRDGHAIVAVDVFRATTTAITAASLGWRCFPAPSIERVVPLAARLHNPLLVGELGGNMPYGFDMNNSPADVAIRSDTYRPMILLSTSGTRLICEAAEWQAVYVACLRNIRAQVAHLAANHPKVAVIGAGTRGEFREEDELCCAWIAQGLLEAGYQPGDARTKTTIDKWRRAPIDEITKGNSGRYLRSTGQERDIDFVVSHVDDLDEIYRYERGELVQPAMPELEVAI